MTPARGERDFALAAVLGLLFLWLGGAAILPTLFLFAAGLAHGAVDVEGDALVRPGWGFSLAYVAVMVLAVLLFLAAPLEMLVVFFALSAWHFAEEQRARGTAALAAWGEGLVLVGLVFALQPSATTALIARMGIDWPPLLNLPMAISGLAGLAAIGWAGRWQRVALFALAYALLPPILAIALHFAFLHAFVRWRELAHRLGGAALRRAVWPFALAALLGAGALLLMVAAAWIPVSWFSAVALAALIPHMLLDRSWAGTERDDKSPAGRVEPPGSVVSPHA